MHCRKFCTLRSFTVFGVFIFCLTQLSGCSFINRSYKSIGVDGPPDIEIDTSKVSDAVPRSEPYHPYHNGNRDYVVAGRRYKVLKNSKGYIKTGYASWYGSKFHGNLTSTQERYNLYGMTAASTELPLPSYVQVTNLRNGKQVIVRVNDRGPFHSKRILDLSYMAAKKLDFIDDGVAPVKIVAIDPKTWNKKIDNKKEIHLQAGAFTNLENAEKASAKIAKLSDMTTYIKHNHSLYRVQIGPIDADQSDRLKLLLEKNGLNHVVVARK